MTRRVLITAAALLGVSLAHGERGLAADEAGRDDAPRRLEEFEHAWPDARLYRERNRISRVYGGAFSRGRSAAESASTFIRRHAGIFGARGQDLAPAGPFPDGAHVVPLGYEPHTGRFRFTSIHYTQERRGIPVFRSRLTLLVRNQPGHPVVLASADLRALGDFDPAATAPLEAGALRRSIERSVEFTPRVSDLRTVIWAGVGEEQSPRLASACLVVNAGAPESDRYLYVVDARSGAVLYREDLILHFGLTGQVLGMATADPGADICSDSTPTPLPHVRIDVGGTAFFADENGDFDIACRGVEKMVVESRLRGRYFRVFNDAGIDALISLIVAPTGPVSFLHNAADAFEFDRAQVNAYLHANLVRDFVLAANPSFPVIGDQEEFTVNVNVNDDCNAFYSPSQQSINFFTSGGGCPNTAFDTVIYHEYGHHLVRVAGSGQGAYGEGMSDSVAVILTDQPVVGAGWNGDCRLWLRTADNDCQYSETDCTSNCGDAIHACGRLLSGSIWSLRQELAETEPRDYQSTLSRLALDSILLHSGSAIDPSITVDFLTLDDDDEILLNGTPHYREIAAAFGAHGLEAPFVPALIFSFPDGLPEMISPFGGDTVRVELMDALDTAQSAIASLFVASPPEPDDFTEIPLSFVAPGLYEAEFPAFACGAEVRYYFSARTINGETQRWPIDAPDETLTAIAATGVVDEFVDDFESEAGWTVASIGGLTAGAWQRALPAGDGTRGDPLFDADGSGQCYLTGNEPGNSDVDGGTTVLLSPLMDASDPNLFLSYQRWYSNVEGNAPEQDTFGVELSGDDGQSWVALETVGPGGEEVRGGWIGRRVRVGSVLAPGGSVRIRFLASDAGPPSIVEAAVDDVRFFRFTCDPPSPCPADVNRDEAVDVQDMVALLLAWGTADADADLDGDGVVDVQDLTALILSWGPCP